MSRDTSEAKATAIRKMLADPAFRRAVSTNAPFRSNLDFAGILQRLEIAEAEYHLRNSLERAIDSSGVAAGDNPRHDAS